MCEQIVLRLYEKEHAAGVAAMWKESRDGWPSGFLGASEFSAESVEMEERASGKLFTVLAIEGTRVVGFCRTTPYGGEPDAAYVALLNVVPDMHGKKIGKRLLLDAVAKTAEQGYDRIDLHTWPANLKAMPLYKKTGFFWVPDTMVYMQNYIPFLMGRPEFREFLGGSSWYECFVRELKVEPDEERTDSGREIFSYLFEIDGRSFRANFDRRGRILSSVETEHFSVSIEREEGKIFFGRPVECSIHGSSLPGDVEIAGHDYLDLPSSCAVTGDSACFTVSHLPVPVPTPERDRSPRVSITLPWHEDIEVGLGIRAEQEVMLVSPPVRRLRADSRSLDINVKLLSSARTLKVHLALDGKTVPSVELHLTERVFQKLEIPLPELPEGISQLCLSFEVAGVRGAEEKLILLNGPCRESGSWYHTRDGAVSIGQDKVLSIRRMGATAQLWGFDTKDRSIPLGGFRLMAGPPFWNSDLPHQIYDFTIEDDRLITSASWPSRPGMRHECSFRLDPAGFAEGMESVTNDTDVEQKVRFSAAWFGSHLFNPRSDLIPLQDGLFKDERIYNQVPDWAEDLPRKTGELGAPWLGMSCPDRSFMVHFKGWNAMQYDAPETEDLLIGRGRTVSSPPLRVLLSEGGTESLLRNAGALGWELGDTEKRIGFLSHNLQPVMTEASELTLSHALRGKRSASISVDGLPLAEGQVCSGTSLTAPLKGTGPALVTLRLAGRDFVYPVHRLGNDVPEIRISEADGLLQIENGRMKAYLNPKTFGHVFSLELDGVEYLMSSHPEPTEFAWEKPWFGGIHPRICDHQEKPFRLDALKPSVERVVPVTGLLPECGWSMAWDIDHKKFGSLRLVWKVTMIPGLPVLKTSFSHEALCGAYPGTESDIRGFLAPGGSHGEAVLTEQARPHLRQGRDTAGAWSIAGKWARVESPSRGFIEAYPNDQGPFYVEDYADSGCHLSLYSFTDQKRELSVTWLFGATKEDEHLSGIFRSYR